MLSEDFNTLLQTSDADRRLAALFAPDVVREQLFALYAFNFEIARIAEATSESLIGEMKLTWWRDAIGDLYLDTPKVRRHDVTEALARLTDRLPEAELMALIEARQGDIAARPFASLDEVVAYVDATSGRLMKLALILCGAELDEGTLRHAGRAWGLTGLVRAFAHRARIGRAPVGLDDLVAAGGNAAMLGQGLGEDKARRALEPVRRAIITSLDGLEAARPMPAEAIPAVGYCVLAGSHFRKLDENPYAIPAEPALLRRQLRLSWLSLTGH